MNEPFAEQLQVDHDDAAYARISDMLSWMGVGAIIGSLATCTAAWVWSWFL